MLPFYQDTDHILLPSLYSFSLVPTYGFTYGLYDLYAEEATFLSLCMLFFRNIFIYLSLGSFTCIFQIPQLKQLNPTVLDFSPKSAHLLFRPNSFSIYPVTQTRNVIVLMTPLCPMQEYLISHLVPVPNMS